MLTIDRIPGPVGRSLIRIEIIHTLYRIPRQIRLRLK